MEQQNSVEWPEGHSGLKAIFDKVTLELGPPDVDFRSGSRNFKVHKKVLEKHSSVLKAKLSDVWQTSGDVLQVDEEYVQPEVVEELLVCLYCIYEGKIPKCSTKNAYSLCIAAHYLMIPKLVRACEMKLCDNITLENFYDLYKLSKHINLDVLRNNCEITVANSPSIYFSSPQVAKWTPEELKMFIEESLKVVNTPEVRETILLSLAIWAKKSFEDRLGELRQLFKLILPETLSSDCLSRFMETELYSRLDELHRKQYYVRPYLPTGMSSTDKLFCISQADSSESYKVHCLDLSAGVKWSDFPPEDFFSAPALGSSWRENIYFIGYTWTGSFVKVFSTETDKWTSFEQPDRRDNKLLAAVASDDYIYIRVVTGVYGQSTSFCRRSLMTEQLETLEDMNPTTMQAHRLVTLDGFIYAIGGGLKQSNLGTELQFHQNPRVEFNRYERYDPQTNRWEYIAPSNYLHQLPAVVAHGEQIYVLGQTGFEAYSPKHDRWNRLPMPDVCFKPSLVSIAGRLWLLTDLADWNSIVLESGRSVYEFDVIKQEWTRLPDLPKADYTDFAFVINH